MIIMMMMMLATATFRWQVRKSQHSSCRDEETESERAPAIYQTQRYDSEMLGPWGLSGNLLAPSPSFRFMLLASNVPANKHLLDEFAKHSSMQSASARS